jgi:hypothetical protein
VANIVANDYATESCNNTDTLKFSIDPPGPNPPTAMPVEPIVTPQPTAPPTNNPTTQPTSRPSTTPTTKPTMPPTNKPPTHPTIAKQCEIEVQVECEDASSPGKTCDDIEPVDFLACHCGGKCTVAQTFQYTGAHCDIAKPGNSCQDISNAIMPDEALIFAVDDNDQIL